MVHPSRRPQRVLHHRARSLPAAGAAGAVHPVWARGGHVTDTWPLLYFVKHSLLVCVFTEETPFGWLKKTSCPSTGRRIGSAQKPSVFPPPLTDGERATAGGMGRWLQKAPWSHLKCFVALCCLQSVNAFVQPAPAKALDRAGRTAGQEGVCRVEKDALRLLVPATTRISAPTVPLRKWLEGRVRTGSQSVVRLDMNSNALGVGAAGTAVASVTTTMPPVTIKGVMLLTSCIFLGVCGATFMR